MILARLRLLCAALEIEDVHMTIREPAAGDSADAAPDEVLKQAEALTGLRLRSAWWIPEDPTLQAGKTYLFHLAFASDSSALPEDFQLTLNGRPPEDLSVERTANEEGRESGIVVTGAWSFQFAAPVKPDDGSRGGSRGSSKRAVPAVNRNPALSAPDSSQTPEQTPSQPPAAEHSGGEPAPTTATPSPVPAVFTDVPAGAYYAEAVGWAVQMGITTGTDEEHFAPHASCTRGQMVTFLWRAAGKPSPATRTNPFADVAGDAYYTEAVLWAYETGITRGTDAAHFSPDAAVSRGQSAAFLYRMAGGQAQGANPFSDVPETSFCYDAVRWAAERGVTHGKTADSFAPGGLCTRAQIVTFLYRLLGQA